MNFFSFEPSEGVERSSFTVSRHFWIYWAFSVPMTFVTLALWFGWSHGAKRLRLSSSRSGALRAWMCIEQRVVTLDLIEKNQRKIGLALFWESRSAIVIRLNWRRVLLPHLLPATHYFPPSASYCKRRSLKTMAKNHQFTIGWISPLPLEKEAARLVLDEEYPQEEVQY